MNEAQRFRLLNELFDRARDLPRAEAESFLAAIADPSLRQELREMLDLDRGGTPAVQTIIDISSVIDEAESQVEVPDRIGPYDILALIGFGASGVVLKARQPETDRLVAVKVLGSGAWNPGALSRFRREIRLLGRLEHPHIARVYDAGTDTTSLPVRPYFVMEYVDGVPLNAWASGAAPRSGSRGEIPGQDASAMPVAPATPRRTTREIVEVFLDIAVAIGYAHTAGVVHRDLKPGNIFVTADHFVKILDFGVSGTLANAPTSTGERTHEPVMTMSLPGVSGGDSLVGTLPYMSPEQFDGTGSVDARSDLYAIGVLLFECLTGRLPYSVEKRTIPEAATIIRDEIPSTIGRIDRAFRGDIEIIVARLLEKDPAQRYQTASELAEDLQRFLDGRPTRARPVSRVERVRRFTRRYRGLMVSVLIAFATLVGLLSYAVHLWQVAETRGDDLALALETTRRADDRRAIRDAEAALQSGSPRDARRALSSVPVDRRAWEWRHLANRAGAESRVVALPAVPMACASRAGRVLVGDLGGNVFAFDSVDATPRLVSSRGDAIRDLALSPDGRAFVVAETSESSLLVQSTETGAMLRIFSTDLGPPTSVTWSDDGRFIGYASFHGRAAVLDAETGEVLQRVGPPVTERVDPFPVRYRDGIIRFFPGGTGFVAAERIGEEATIVPSLDADPIVVPTGGAVIEHLGASLSESGPLALVGDFDGRVHCFSGVDGRLVRTVVAHRGALRTLVDGPGEHQFTTGSTDGTIHVFDGDRGVPVGDAFGAELHVRGVAHDADSGLLIAVGDDRCVRMWSVARHVAEPVLREHRAWVYSIAFGGDGALYSGGGHVPRIDGRVMRWDLAMRLPTSEVKLAEERTPNIVWSIAPDPRGGVVAASADRIWMIGPDGTSSFRVPSSVYAVSTVAGGDVVAALRFESNLIEVYARDGTLIASAPRPSGSIAMGALASDGIGEAFYVGDGTNVIAYELERDGGQAALRRVATTSVGAAVTDLAVSVDARSIAIGCAGGAAILLERTPTGEFRRRWRVVANPGEAVRVAIAPDGSRVVTGGTGPMIRVWDSADGEPLLSLTGHGDSIHDIEFSGDGSTLATASIDGTVRLWFASPVGVDLVPRSDTLFDRSPEADGPAGPRDRDDSNEPGQPGLVGATAGRDDDASR
ncbi:MAG: protein kinase [Planctomycetaceae bacterium]|nr:protein kinase [Planctomycetaceae bacterium]